MIGTKAQQFKVVVMLIKILMELAIFACFLLAMKRKNFVGDAVAKKVDRQM